MLGNRSPPGNPKAMADDADHGMNAPSLSLFVSATQMLPCNLAHTKGKILPEGSEGISKQLPWLLFHS